VRHIFRLAIEGNGALTIAKLLNTKKVPVIGREVMKGRTVSWSSTTIKCILTSRAAIGEYIPYKLGSDKPQGEPVTNYFPPVIDEATFYAAQNALKTRAVVGRGRKGKHVNLLAGLLIDARTGEDRGRTSPSRASGSGCQSMIASNSVRSQHYT
jgi:hypothetical protein